MSPSKINVGISVFATPGANIWSSGINQNLAFLVLLLRRSPNVAKVYLLNGGDSGQLPPGLGFEGLDAVLVRPAEVTHELDVVIELGAQLPLEWLQHVRALGTRIVAFFVGNTYANLCEGPMFGQPGGSKFHNTPWHEVWILPHHAKTCLPMLKTVARVPVFTMPHLWSPLFLERQIKQLEQGGHHFGFQPADSKAGRRGWRMAIFEPNISVVKNCVIPMLVCEQAYRLQPESVARMMVMNSFHMKEHPTFNRFAANLDLTRDGKASYEPSISFAECMAEQTMDAVVAHHWECGLNYAYYDALHGGYPLIHNSSFLQNAGVGLSYPGFAAAAGGDVLLEAWHRELGFWDDYRRHGVDHLQSLAPTHPDNIQTVMARLLHSGNSGL